MPFVRSGSGCWGSSSGAEGDESDVDRVSDVRLSFGVDESASFKDALAVTSSLPGGVAF